MFIKLENNFFIKVIEENKVNFFDNDFIVRLKVEGEE
jgi:hypothetical protein